MLNSDPKEDLSIFHNKTFTVSLMNIIAGVNIHFIYDIKPAELGLKIY
jgi:hydroxymethylglutaryl-CoA reductase